MTFLLFLSSIHLAWSWQNASFSSLFISIPEKHIDITDIITHTSHSKLSFSHINFEKSFLNHVLFEKSGAENLTPLNLHSHTFSHHNPRTLPQPVSVLNLYTRTSTNFFIPQHFSFLNNFYTLTFASCHIPQS